MKKRRFLVAIVCCLYAIFNTSCGLFHPPKRQNGYLVNHYYSCGPRALEKAITQYSKKYDVEFKRSHTSKELSIEIQDGTVLFDLREFLTLIDKRAAEITWPKEIERSLKLRGITIREISKIDELKSKDGIAIILIHWKGKLTWYHWIVWPGDDLNYYGKDTTVIDRIFLLEPLKR